MKPLVSHKVARTGAQDKGLGTSRARGPERSPCGRWKSGSGLAVSHSLVREDRHRAWGPDSPGCPGLGQGPPGGQTALCAQCLRSVVGRETASASAEVVVTTQGVNAPVTPARSPLACCGSHAAWIAAILSSSQCPPLLRSLRHKHARTLRFRPKVGPSEGPEGEPCAAAVRGSGNR